MNTETSTQFELTKPRLRLSRIAFYGVSLIVLLILYFKFSEIQSLRDLFFRANGSWLCLIVASQLLTYYFLSHNYRDVLRMKNLKISVSELFPITFVIQFITQALPTAGISGQVFFIYYLKKYGLTLAEGMARAVLELMTLYLAYSATFVLAVILLLQNHILLAYPVIWIFVYAFVFFASITLFIFFAFQRRHRLAWIHWVIDRLHRYFEYGPLAKIKDIKAVSDHSHHVSAIIEECKNTLDIDFIKQKKSLFWQAVGWQFLLLLANAMTLYLIAHAIQKPISFAVAFAVWTLAKLISITSFVPGSLGIFEIGMTAVFKSFGIPWSDGLALTLFFRAFTFWLPMPIGWVLYGHYMRKFERDDQKKIVMYEKNP